MKTTRILSALLSLCLLLAGLPALSEAPDAERPELAIAADGEIEAAPEDADGDAPLWALEAEDLDEGPSLAEEGLLSNAAGDAAQEAPSANGAVPIDEARFPDYSFRFFIRKLYDTDGEWEPVRQRNRRRQGL